MINPKKLIKMARKWQRLAALKREKISLPSSHSDTNTSSNNLSPVADKGHFVVYTPDQTRFMFPMSYLNNHVFRELLAMAEEEFGLPGNGPITLPCDATFMEYVISFIKRQVDQELEKALLMSIASGRCSLSCCPYQGQSSQQLVVC